MCPRSHMGDQDWEPGLTLDSRTCPVYLMSNASSVWSPFENQALGDVRPGWS